MVIEVPRYEVTVFAPKSTRYAVCIPVINEGDKILAQLARMQACGTPRLADILMCDGGSTDGSMDPGRLGALAVNTLLVKTGPGKLSAQLRMGYSWALERGYAGVITLDGNGKDSVESLPLFVTALDQGYDLVQGSRYLPGGQAIRTPRLRHLAIKLVHVPLVSWIAKFPFTDTTNGFRGYSGRYLRHAAVQPFRQVFATYELLAYLSVRAPQLGLQTIEVPVTRAYPPSGRLPTKISLFRGNLDLLRILVGLWQGKYNPTGPEAEAGAAEAPR